jgi:hypothetical protein
MAQSINVETSAETGFDARLKGVSLVDLIQLQCLSGASECFHVTSGKKAGVLHFANGVITHATAGDLDGDQAVLELLGWTTGTFDHASIPASDESLVRSAWQGLLLEFVKIQDERNRHIPLLSQRLDIDGSPGHPPPIDSTERSSSRPWAVVASAAQIRR